MENSSLPTVVWENITPAAQTASTESDNLSHYIVQFRDYVLKVVYIMIGTLGVVDNTFVFIVFFLFIKISEKV